MMIALSLTLLLSGVLITTLCLPLIYEKVPMNLFFGMRTRHAFRSDESWFHLNAIGGMFFSLLGFPLILGGTLGFFLTEEHTTALGLITGVVSLASIAFAIWMFIGYSIRYTERKEQHRCSAGDS